MNKYKHTLILIIIIIFTLSTTIGYASSVENNNINNETSTKQNILNSDNLDDELQIEESEEIKESETTEPEETTESETKELEELKEDINTNESEELDNEENNEEVKLPFTGITDYTEFNKFSQFAEKLVEYEILIGTPEGLSLDNSITKLEASILFGRLFKIDYSNYVSNNNYEFKDVPEEYVNLIEYLCDKGFLNYKNRFEFDSNETFSLDNYVYTLLCLAGYVDIANDESIDNLLYIYDMNYLEPIDLHLLKNEDFSRGHLSMLTYKSMFMKDRFTDKPIYTKHSSAIYIQELNTPLYKNNNAEFVQYYLEFLDRINEIRDEKDMSALLPEFELLNIAYIKSNDMAQKKEFSDISSNYGNSFELLRFFGMPGFTKVEEGISWISYEASPENLVKIFESSEVYENGVLDKRATHLAIGIEEANKYGNEGFYFTIFVISK